MTLPGDIVIRPLTGPEELDLFRAIPYSLDDELADDLANGHRRPGWMWVALRGGRLVAKAAWWGGRDDARPAALDVLDVLDGVPDPDGDRIEVGVRLLETAMSAVIPAGTPPPAYIRFVPPDWREHPRSRRI
ncbi:MAG TPA: GNAT family N-acetyltransferase, partial [Streptosporangiaceae bacterium]